MKEIDFLIAQIQACDENLLVIDLKKAEFAIPSEIPLTIKKDEEKIKEKLKEYKYRLEQLREGKPISFNETGSLFFAGEIQKIYIDRNYEENLFRDMIYDRTKVRILIIEAEKGMGKTTLLKKLFSMSEDFKRAKIDFDCMSYSFEEIIQELGNQLGRKAFVEFNRECKEFLLKYGQQTDNPALFCSKIRLLLAELKSEVKTMETSKTIRKVLTDAFFAGIASMCDDENHQPVILLFDTYEKSSSDIKEWLTEQAIMSIRNNSRLICVIAGQETPRVSAEGDDWCLKFELKGIHDEHVKMFLQRLNIQIDDKTIKIITKASKGNPFALKSLIIELVSNGDI